MTALLWAASFAWSAWRLPDRPKNYFLMLGIGEFAVLGAFLAQDLLLFVLFFDLMLVPFFFLIGSYGTGDRVRATIKMMVYTLVGSLLMLVGGDRDRRSSPRRRRASSRSRWRTCARTSCPRAARSGSSASSPPRSW